MGAPLKYHHVWKDWNVFKLLWAVCNYLKLSLNLLSNFYPLYECHSGSPSLNKAWKRSNIAVLSDFWAIYQPKTCSSQIHGSLNQALSSEQGKEHEAFWAQWVISASQLIAQHSMSSKAELHLHVRVWECNSVSFHVLITRGALVTPSCMHTTAGGSSPMLIMPSIDLDFVESVIWLIG